MLLDTSKAKLIKLPKLIFGKSKTNIEHINQAWTNYFYVYNKGLSYYKRGWYNKAKVEFLKIHNYHNTTKALHTHLLRCYRKQIDRVIGKKRYYDAYDLMIEMFKSCKNTTNSDIKRYNMIIQNIKNMQPDFLAILKELVVDNEPEFKILKNFVEVIANQIKPRWFRYPKDKMSFCSLKKRSNLIPASIPYLLFDGGELKYLSVDNLPSIRHDIWRFRESIDRMTFIAISYDNEIYIYNWDLNVICIYNASNISKVHNHLRQAGLLPGKSLFYISHMDRLYIFGFNGEMISEWLIPYKEGWEKVSASAIDPLVDSKYKDSLRLLNLSNDANIDQIKSSFRKMVKRFHPDLNPIDPYANDRMRAMIEAYEYVTKSDIREAGLCQ